MSDLRTRFQKADLLPAPDLWPGIEQRMSQPRGDHATHRLLVAVVVLGLFMSASILLWSAFRPGERSSSVPPGSPAGSGTEASVWCKEGVGCPDPDTYEGKDVPFERPGPSHCSWQSETFISFGARQYIRDEDNSLTNRLGVAYDADARLPADARYTGWHEGQRELWVAPSEIDRAGTYESIYIVTPDRVERWPRLDAYCV